VGINKKIRKRRGLCYLSQFKIKFDGDQCEERFKLIYKENLLRPYRGERKKCEIKNREI
jgi:hypothetical protein